MLYDVYGTKIKHGALETADLTKKRKTTQAPSVAICATIFKYFSSSSSSDTEGEDMVSEEEEQKGQAFANGKTNGHTSDDSENKQTYTCK